MKPNFFKVRESCGILGIFSHSNCLENIYGGLLELQHRGQESCGIATCDGDMIKLRKGMGMVYQAFEESRLENLSRELKGNFGIGHVRYSTTGSTGLKNAQPLMVYSRMRDFALAHNGNILNYLELRKKLEEEGYSFITTTDTEIIAKLIAEGENLMEGIKRASERLKGSYCLIILSKDGLLAVRDPYGFRPLVIGKGNHGYCFASEPCAFLPLGMELVRDVEPGEIMHIDKNGKIHHEKLSSPKRAYCVFERVYFARPDSIIDGTSVVEVRNRLGRNLARREWVDADIVAEVPDSGIDYAQGYHEESGITYKRVFSRKRHYLKRVFIEPQEDMRSHEVDRKFSVIKDNTRGKKIILVDDSIVRGNTMRRLIKKLKEEGGAREVHVRIGSPPVRSACPFGIDMQTKREFIIDKMSPEEIRKFIGADSLLYQTEEDLIDGIGLPRNSVCIGCWNGEYPMEIPPGYEKYKI